MRIPILFLLIVVLSVTHTFGQNDSLLTEDIFKMSLADLMDVEVSGVSRYKQDVADVASSIQVITKRQIVDRGYFDLSDLLRDVQGFDISENAGRFGEFYTFRGVSGSDRFLVLIDGHKLNPATGTFLSIGNSISIRHAERIEIIYGPASAVYGADAFSGIINIVMKAADSEDISASAYINYGTANAIDGAFETIIKINDDLSFMINARLYKSEGFDVQGTKDIYDIIDDYKTPISNKCEQPINDHNLFVSAYYKKFTFNYYRQQFEQGNALGHSPNFYVFDKSNKWETATNMFWITYQNTFANDGTLTFDINYKNHLQDNNTIFHKWSIPGNTDNTYNQYMTGLDNTIHAVLSYNQEVSEQFGFIAGIDYEYTSSIPPYANDQVLGASRQYIGDDATKIQDELTITENRFAFFAQCMYTPSLYFSVVAGARYDYSSRYEGVFNPRVGIVISPSEHSKIKMMYGRAFQAPSLFYQYEQFGTPSIVMLSTAELRKDKPEWQLENQIVNSYELIYSQKIGDNIEVRVNSYYNKLENLIQRKMYTDEAYNKYFDKNTAGLRNENFGEQNIYGVDLAFNAKVSDHTLMYFNYSYTDAVSVTDDSETRTPRVAEHKLWVGLTIAELFDFVTVSPRFRWSGNIYNLNTIEFPDNKQQDYSTIDINLSTIRIKDRFRIYANFQNILNTEIFHSGLYGQTGIYTAVLPQEQFSFRAGVEIYFNK